MVQDKRPSMGKFGPEIDAPINSSLVYSFTGRHQKSWEESTWAQAGWTGSADHSCSRGGTLFSSQGNSRWWRQASWDRNRVSLACPALVILSVKGSHLSTLTLAASCQASKPIYKTTLDFSSLQKRMQLKGKRQCLPVQANCKNPALQWAGLKVFSRKDS